MPAREPALHGKPDCYTPLIRAPVAVSIETKVLGGSPEEGRLQLAIWTAAWHQRMEALGIGGKGRPLLPTLPLILTMDHNWMLFFACDRGTKIVCFLSYPLFTYSSLLPIPSQEHPIIRNLLCWRKSSR